METQQRPLPNIPAWIDPLDADAAADHVPIDSENAENCPSTERDGRSHRRPGRGPPAVVAAAACHWSVQEEVVAEPSGMLLVRTLYPACITSSRPRWRTRLSTASPDSSSYPLRSVDSKETQVRELLDLLDRGFLHALRHNERQLQGARAEQ